MKTQLFKSVLAVTTASIALGSFATQASAVDLTPSEEGEVNVGLDIDGAEYLDNNSFTFIDSIVSEVDASTGSRSRLFIDDLTTQNTYTGGIRLKSKDAGTNHTGMWFRPSEFADGQSEESGQLEVGTFTFNFNTVFEDLNINWFDTESNNTTGVTAINGQTLDSPDWVAKGSNGNIFTQTFANVQSITLKLGNDSPNGTGDGVNFQLSGNPVPASVPEPATLGGLAVVGLALAGRRKLQNRG
ncbi:MAG: LEVG family PEP-CTERM protein [Microcoleaceae cyanobacterium]